ncbi:hypothetical protein Peur_047211 [Populus x canadensis]|uniref:F-actin-capping protein subunit alpha n=1 Tax=Populus deltoides TaxID=3696 RepID=A0A8T2ZG17_POPDE|nr:hypothetical protein H0E87_004288 [Populus deltoides]
MQPRKGCGNQQRQQEQEIFLVFCQCDQILSQASYSKFPDATFKDLRRKPPVTGTLFSWHNALQFSLTRDIHEELGIDK